MASYRVYCGLDADQGDPRAVALDRAGRRLHDGLLPNDERRLRAIFDPLIQRGPLLVVVDRPATIGALAVVAARACGVDVAYLPGLARRRIADLDSGLARTDAREAFVIADTARTVPQSLRRVDVGDDAWSTLRVLVGNDDDLAQGSTRLIDRIRTLLAHIHPALERALGPKLHGRAAVELLSRFGGPAGLRRAGPRKLAAATARTDAHLVEAIMAALTEPAVPVRGTAATETVLSRLADALRDVQRGRAELAAQVEEILDAHPLAVVLI